MSLRKCLLIQQHQNFQSLFVNSLRQFQALNYLLFEDRMQMMYAVFYYVPTPPTNTFLPLVAIEPDQSSHKPENRIEAPVSSIRKSEQFLKLFEEQLKQTSIKYIKKVWTKQDDKLLLDLKKYGFKWTEISERITNSNPQTCKRRYLRLKQNEEKWPQQLQEEIRRVCEMSNLKWEQKIKILHSKFPEIKNYSKKMIKQRYLTYLESTIEQKPWTLQEDMILIRMLQKGIKRWKSISHALPGRSELHLKNRYYGCLRNIQQKVENILLYTN